MTASILKPQSLLINILCCCLLGLLFLIPTKMWGADVYYIEIRGNINPATARYLARAIEETTAAKVFEQVTVILLNGIPQKSAVVKRKIKWSWSNEIIEDSAKTSI